MLLSGACIGILAGLSVSPVIQGVITTALSIVGLLLTAVSGLSVDLPQSDSNAGTRGAALPELQSSNRSWSHLPHGTALTLPKQFAIFAKPVAIMLVGAVLGACFGIWVRTHGFLEPKPIDLVQRWATIGVGQSQVAELLLAEAYPNTYPRLHMDSTATRRSLDFPEVASVQNKTSNTDKKEPHQNKDSAELSERNVENFTARKKAGVLFSAQVPDAMRNRCNQLTVKKGTSLGAYISSLPESEVAPLKRMALRFKNSDDLEILIEEICAVQK